MDPYRLTPIESEVFSERWKSSTIGPVQRWVRANDPMQARERVARAMLATNVKGGEGAWVRTYMVERMVSCEMAETVHCGPREIRTDDGQSLPIDE
jgi:hypothetical protein